MDNQEDSTDNQNSFKAKNTNNNQERNMLNQIANFCIKAKQTVDGLSEQIQKIKEFHTENLHDKAQFAKGANRLEALQNLDDVASGLTQASKEVQEILNQIGQTRSPKYALTPSGLGGSSSEEETVDYDAE